MLCYAAMIMHDSPFTGLLPGPLDLAALSPFQRILLTADGTLTTLLEVYLGERLGVVKLHESITEVTQAIDYLNVPLGESIIARQILLQGQSSQRHWLYADSVLVPGRLEAGFREQLLHSSMPIGKLWLAHKTETFKEIVDARLEPAGDIAPHFEIKTTDPLLSRSYLVFCQGQAVMLITEKFPASYFL